MSKVIPQLSAREINRCEDYERLFHAKRYIGQKSSLYKDTGKPTEPILELMKAVNYSKYNKFKEHRRQWDSCEKSIPLAYLRAIDADIEILKFTVSVDQEEYENAAQIITYPKHFMVRLMAAFYQSLKIPDGMSENDAVGYVKEFSREKRLRCCIATPPLKSIFIEPDGKVNYIYYRPEIKISKNEVSFSYDGRDIGTVAIK
ncbi:MAG: hypothetical protein OEZ13_04330 [Spirochaetia bacterium]|nr:hypothetical protein [Spirochaetia bacterium]